MIRPQVKVNGNKMPAVHIFHEKMIAAKRGNSKQITLTSGQAENLWNSVWTLAQLSSDSPAFHSPLAVMAAKRVRDYVIEQQIIDIQAETGL